MNESATSPRVAPGRPVRLLDLLALVAATALALGMPEVVKALTPEKIRTQWAYYHLVKFSAVATLYGWTAVLLGLRLADRPTLRRGRPDAGLAALVAVAAAFALLALKLLAEALVFAGSRGRDRLAETAWFVRFLHPSADAVGAAVLAVWLSLALGGALRRPPNWPSWAAVLLGGLWILLTLFESLIHYLPISWLYRSAIR